MNKIIYLITLFFVGTVNAAFIEHIENGDFETGDLSGWTSVNTGSGEWNINDGTFPINGGFASLDPISGNFDVVTTQSGPGFHKLYQEVFLGTFDTATISWIDRYRTNANLIDPIQEWRVLIEDLNGNLITEVFSTDPGDIGISTLRTIRATNLPILRDYFNQSVRISFEQEDNLSFFSVSLDNISFRTETISSVPEPMSLAIFSLSLVGFGFSIKRNKV